MDSRKVIEFSQDRVNSILKEDMTFFIWYEGIYDIGDQVQIKNANTGDIETSVIITDTFNPRVSKSSGIIGYNFIVLENEMYNDVLKKRLEALGYL